MDTHTDTLTDANRFYNLSHAICYSYGTDNKITAYNKCLL